MEFDNESQLSFKKNIAHKTVSSITIHAINYLLEPLVRRMGWFLPSAVVEEEWHKNTTVDHWRALLIQSVARSFSWWGRSEWRNICPDCEAAAYRSSRCSKSRKNCATESLLHFG